MNNLLLFAIVTITLALIFYTIGVLGERKAGILKKSHLIVFWCGLICDTSGTTAMTKIAGSNAYAVKSAVVQLLHGTTGILAIVLMLFHALWATWVLFKGDEKRKVIFHKFSIIVWLIWLIPYFVGAFAGMGTVRS